MKPSALEFLFENGALAFVGKLSGAKYQQTLGGVFLDLGMPRLDGIEAARRIRQTPAGHDARLIALTGWGQEADRQRTREAGFDQHVIKPIDAPQLNAILGS